jgi:cyclin-dependent kinase 10
MSAALERASRGSAASPSGAAAGDARPGADVGVQDLYEKLGRIGEGTYGVVYRARDRRTGAIVALKKVRMDKERDGIPITALREVRILQASRHPSIVTLLRVVTGKSPNMVFLAFEYCEHDLARLTSQMRVPFTEAQVKRLVTQLLSAVAYLHSRWIFHRDLKLSNLLYTDRGVLKLCDFGLARDFSPAGDGAYTAKVVTLWYRAPELLLGTVNYGAAVDMWAVGCILAELLLNDPLFPGKTEANVLERIVNLIGSPNDGVWPGWERLPRAAATLNVPKQPYNYIVREFPSPEVYGEGVCEVLNELLVYDPKRRAAAEDVLAHPYLAINEPRPTPPEDMPRFPPAADAERFPSAARPRPHQNDPHPHPHPHPHGEAADRRREGGGGEGGGAGPGPYPDPPGVPGAGAAAAADGRRGGAPGGGTEARRTPARATRTTRSRSRARGYSSDRATSDARGRDERADVSVSIGGERIAGGARERRRRPTSFGDFLRRVRREG